MVNLDKLGKAFVDVETKQAVLNKATEARDKASSDLSVAVTKAASELDAAKAIAKELQNEFNSQANGLLQ